MIELALLPPGPLYLSLIIRVFHASTPFLGGLYGRLALIFKYRLCHLDRRHSMLLGPAVDAEVAEVYLGASLLSNSITRPVRLACGCGVFWGDSDSRCVFLISRFERVFTETRGQEYF